jgi:hypothetical protein
MMIRYHHNVPAPPAAPSGARIGTVSVISESSDTITESTQIIGGPASGNVTIKVTSYGGVPGSYFNLNGTNMVLDDTAVIPLDASGAASYVTITHCGPGFGGGGGFSCAITIIAVSAGAIGSPASRTYSHTS